MGIKSHSIVAVDDDVKTLDRIRVVLDSTHVVLATSDPHRAAAWLQNDTTISAIVVSQILKTGKALTLLQAAQKLRPDARRILIANYSDLAQLVDALHSGAVQRTISKPIDATELLGLVKMVVVPIKPGTIGSSATA